MLQHIKFSKVLVTFLYKQLHYLRLELKDYLIASTQSRIKQRLVDLIVVIDTSPSRKNEAQAQSKAAASAMTSFID